VLNLSHFIARKIFYVRFISQNDVEDWFGLGKFNVFCHVSAPL